MSVEQAADRLRLLEAGCQPYPEDKRQFWWAMQTADEVTCGRAYLDLFDPTPLSEEVLLLAGYQKTASGWWVCDGAPELSDSDDAGRRCVFGVSSKYGIKTVGDLRRLLSALHIDVEVRLP